MTSGGLENRASNPPRVEALPSSASGDRRSVRWPFLIAGVIFVGSLVVYFWPRRCAPRSLAQAVECLKRDGTLPPKTAPLSAPESGSLLGFRVMKGELERSSSCYGGTRTESGTSLAQLEVRYDNRRSLEQDLHALNSDLRIGSKDSADVKLVLENLTISRTTGVFDPLSACQAGIHEVVVWELRAGQASLVGSTETVRSITAHTDAGPVTLGADSAGTDGETFKVIAKNIVFAYLTEKLETDEASAQTTWTEDVRPNDAVRLPSVPSFQHGLALKVKNFDRRNASAFEFRLSGRQAMSATCAAGTPGAFLELSMGVGDSCHVSINDATQLALQTAITGGEVRVTTTLARTTRVESKP